MLAGRWESGGAGSTVTVDRAYVKDRLSELAGDSDLSKYIL